MSFSKEIVASTKSRRAIMDRLESRSLPETPRPEADFDRFEQFDDPLAKFTEMLEFVGGQSHLVEDAADVAKVLAEFEAFKDAKRIASLVPEAVQGNMNTTEIDDPHGLATLDWAIVKGEFAVAENGAIWVTGDRLPHRVMLFITQFLCIVVSRSEILNHMHEAYRRIGDPGRGFGVFVSGPSKTADIEQSLVLGAHGCRNLHVFLTK